MKKFVFISYDLWPTIKMFASVLRDWLNRLNLSGLFLTNTYVDSVICFILFVCLWFTKNYYDDQLYESDVLCVITKLRNIYTFILWVMTYDDKMYTYICTNNYLYVTNPPWKYEKLFLLPKTYVILSYYTLVNC